MNALKGILEYIKSSFRSKSINNSDDTINDNDDGDDEKQNEITINLKESTIWRSGSFTKNEHDNEQSQLLETLLHNEIETESEV
jgi:hypothetical protein